MIDILVEPGLVRGAPEPERTGHGPLSHRLPAVPAPSGRR
ncbi:hypothetical protein J2853_003282 [Streptosporangium lutulentum]|uniref:Uncharacterized protein n=1 Tax=Streptosporangium lutulentum TaxID=1461250 RepID=A0ABT9QCH5_9ACTN|nr:hypothetical protein [Streptosporangium lutulentum]